MGRFKGFFSKNKEEKVVAQEVEEVVEEQDIEEEMDISDMQDAPEDGAPAMQFNIAMLHQVGYNDAVDLLTEAYTVHYWHDVEIDEEDVPETEEDLLLACRPANGDRGFEYHVGQFDDSVSGWKQIHYADPNEDEVELDETFVERRLQGIQEQLPEFPNFDLIKRMYIEGFGEGSRYMKRVIQDYKWHAIADVEKDLRKMDEEVMAAVEENGEIHFEVVSQDEFTMEEIDGRYIAWANIEPFDSVMDQV